MNLSYYKKTKYNNGYIKSTYNGGRNPCGNCQSTRHLKCRPRLDGTLCSCSCDTAKENRTIYEMECRIAKREGRNEPTVYEALKTSFPRICKKTKEQ